MKRTKLIILLFSVLMLFAGTGAYAALTVTVDLGPGNEPVAGLLAADIEDQLSKYGDMPDFTRGFANANTYATNAATMRGYQGYDLISIALGTMYTVQAPSADPLFFQSIQDELDDGDIYTGLGVVPWAGQVGLNMGFIIPDLYIAFKFGKLKESIDAGSYKLDFDTNLLGVIVDYQLVSSKSILAGILLWKGLNIESGFIYSTNKVVYYKELDTIIADADGGGTNTAELDPTLDLALDIKSYIIPVEVYSAFRLFYMINFGVGIGMDYVYDNTTDLRLRSSGTITGTGLLTGQNGVFEITAPTSEEADKYRFKGMVNVGVGFGPVFVDVPITFYLDNGYAVGLSAGIVW